MIHKFIVLVLVGVALILGTSTGRVAGRTVGLTWNQPELASSSPSPEDKTMKSIDSDHESLRRRREEQHQQQLQAKERRAVQGTLSSGLQPLYFWATSSTVYGGYSAKTLQLVDNNSKNKSGLKINIGSIDFYSKDLYSYINSHLTANNYGVYGFAAHYNTQKSGTDYAFFKSISTDTNSLSAKGSPSDHQSRSLELGDSSAKTVHQHNKRQDDQVQCRNHKGESTLFSKNDCSLAAAKMASEKTAMSSCGSCQLVMIGPQGQLSSSNMPAGDLQSHAANILAGCTLGQRTDSLNIIGSSFSNSIPDNAKPNFVILLAKGLGASCN